MWPRSSVTLLVMPSTLLARLTQGPLIADGAMGTRLYERGIPFDQCFDELNRSQPAEVEAIHREYLSAGAELIETNTFGANPLRLAAHGLEGEARLLARQGVKVARAAREIVGVNAFVAGSIGPLGRPLEPFGQITVAEAETAFRTSAEGLLECGCDCVILETFQDLNELLAALRAVRRVSLHLPVIAQMTVGIDCKTSYRDTPALSRLALRHAVADDLRLKAQHGR